MNIEFLSLELQKKVLSYLKENFYIPKEGFLAGQSVASVVYKFLNLPLDCVINDLDIFQHADKNLLDVNREIGCKKHNIDTKILIEKDYEGIKITCNDSGRGYNVVSADTHPKYDYINRIHISTFNNIDNEPIPFEGVLRTFDFNFCSVGIDLSTGNFYWTESFIYFLNTLELQIQSTHTPIRCLIRLNKKLKEFPNIKCNIKEQQKLLVFSHLFNEHESNITGIKFWERFEENKKGIEKFFKFDDFFFENQKLYRSVSLVKEALIEEGLVDYLKSDLSDYCFSSYHINKILNIKLEDFTILNTTQIVHFYHLNFNTGIFSLDYKNKIKNFFNRQTKEKRELYQSLYFKIVSNKPFDMIELPNPDEEKIIEKLFLGHMEISCSLKQNFKSFKQLLNFVEIYSNCLDTEKYFLIPLVTNKEITSEELPKLFNMEINDCLNYLYNKLHSKNFIYDDNILNADGILIQKFNNVLDLINFQNKHNLKCFESIYHLSSYLKHYYDLYYIKSPMSEGFFSIISSNEKKANVTKCFKTNNKVLHELNDIENIILNNLLKSIVNEIDIKHYFSEPLQLANGISYIKPDKETNEKSVSNVMF